MRGANTSSVWRRVVWLIAFWCAGVLSLAVLAWLVKLFMRTAGLTP
ncbi:MAG: hypothetical protein JWP22_4170 [Ramlibacter sp.]|jgi:hypothetical protein|nr:hypothetical protein [Ramlibacter sp.]MDB5915495.1 hypothetical protein [Ramlibacter sp.]